LRNIDTLIFDLDNTLYDESYYILAAHKEIAEFLSEKGDVSGKEIFKILRSDFHEKTSMYSRLFNDLLEKMNLEITLLSDLMKIYSNIKPNIELYPAVKTLLIEIKIQKKKLGLLTNGTVDTQRNKVNILNLKKYFDSIIIARSYGKDYEKPNPKIYTIILQELNSKPKNSVYIGDNPYTDFIGAKKLD